MSVYAFSDLHAQYDLWLQIKEYIKPDDIVYCLGDCIDRGDVGFEILYEIMETPNITLLRGNHEDFIVSIGSEILKYESDENVNWITPAIYLWEANGGSKSIEAFEKLSLSEKKKLISKIKSLPTHIEYVNKKGDIIYLCHAGRTPKTIEIEDMHLGDIPMDNYIWDRYHIMQPHWCGKSIEYCVHGHTPVGSIYYYINPEERSPETSAQIYKYCDGHKIDIDLGSCASHHACLLDLDTFKPIYFKDRTFTEWEEVYHGVT